MRLGLVCVQFLLINQTTFSQIPTTGFEIEGILVDGCDGGNEGKNEMVTFRNGPVALDINNIRVDGGGATGVIMIGQWPSNSFLGWCRTAGATSNIAVLDAAITTTCGKLLEPPSGIIPAGGKVLIVTSTDFTAVSSYFANLTDTLYVVLQCAGNTGGHFANYNATSSNRTLVLTNTVTGFADTIVYNRSLLLNSGGTPGAGDGGAVSYSWNGTPSYFNNGCQAPFIPLSVSIDPILNADCLTNVFSFSGNVMSGNYKDVIWTTSGSGVFSDANSIATNYTPGIGELGSISISFKAVDYCNDTTTITQNITVSPVPVANAGTDFSLCSGSTIVLGTTPISGFSYLWNSITGLNNTAISNPSLTLTNLTSSSIISTYTVVTTVSATGCTAFDDVFITVIPSENPSFTTSPTCTGGTATIIGSTGGTFTFTSPPSDGAIINANSGTISNGISGTTYNLTYTTIGSCPSSSNGSVTANLQGNSTFTTTGTCTGGTVEITGDLGGTFTFTSLPADWAILNTNTGEITNGTSGTTYNLTYTTSGLCPSSSNGSVTANAQGNSTFTTTGTCTGGIALITGDLGGTFIFTSLPSDAAILNSTSGEITNGTSGTTYNLTYTTGGPCPSTSNSIVTALIQDNASLTTTPTCSGGTVLVEGTVGGVFTFFASPTDNAIINSINGTISNGTYNTTYYISYTTTGTCNIISNDSVTSSLSLNALSNFSGNSNYCSFETIADLSVVPNVGGTITWFSDSLLQTIISTGPSLALSSSVGISNYYATETLNGCESTPIQITITISNCDIVIPTAFTPDGDGVNDKWELANIDLTFPENTVKIYNRWGSLLFESSKGSYEKMSWNGEYKGELLPIESYYFIIEFNSEYKDASTGTVSIVK